MANPKILICDDEEGIRESFRVGSVIRLAAAAELRSAGQPGAAAPT